MVSFQMEGQKTIHAAHRVSDHLTLCGLVIVRGTPGGPEAVTCPSCAGKTDKPSD